MPSNITCQPMPHAPRVGDSQLSSSNLTSCCRGLMPHASRLSRYSCCTSSGAGFEVQRLLERAAARRPELGKLQDQSLKRHESSSLPSTFLISRSTLTD